MDKSSLFDQALSHYSSNNYDLAISLFRRLGDESECPITKSALTYYIERCRNQICKPSDTKTANKIAESSYDYQVQLIESQNAFDSCYYLSQNPDVENTTIKPLDHFLQFGYKENRDPHPHFNITLFREYLSDRGIHFDNPLVFYLENKKSFSDQCPAGSFSYRDYLSKLNKSLVYVDGIKVHPVSEDDKPRIAVLVHAYYVEPLQDLLDSLKVIPFKYDLHISTNTLEKSYQISDLVSELDVKTTIYITPNIGRDLGPFFHTIGQLQYQELQYDFYLKLHTKQSADSSDHLKDLGTRWSHFIISSLLGTTKNVTYIIQCLSSEEAPASLVSPLAFPPIYKYCVWEKNLDYIKHLQSEFNLDAFATNKPFDFPAGSMYWLSRAALMSLYKNFQPEFIPAEPIPRNNTYLHAFERLVPHILSKENLACLYHCDLSNVSLLEAINCFSIRPSSIVSFRQIIAWRLHLVRSIVDYLCENSLAEFSFPLHEKPSLSIVIPIYTDYKITLQCLVSLFLVRHECNFEIILVDDCSPDNSSSYIEGVRGVKILRNSENLGFVGTCNRGAKIAKSETLFFLNNDTVVLDNSISEILRALEDPSVGLTGSKLIYEDGALQEAGGCIWFDGGALNYGRNSNPLDPRYCYDRNVDYLSGASIAIKKDLFFKLGCFDTRFSPGYYEDTDLAMKVRHSGLDVRLSHLSIVIHLEGKSSVDETQGMKRFQKINKVKFLDKWSHQLSTHNYLKPDKCKHFYDRKSFKTIMFIDCFLPTPDKDSGSNDIYIAMKICRKFGFEVIFVPTIERQSEYKYLDMLRRSGIVTYAQDPNSTPDALVRHIVKVHKPDICHISRYNNWHRFFGFIQRLSPTMEFIFDTVDLHHLRHRREAELANSSEGIKESSKIEQAEFKAIEQAQTVLLRSSVEKKLLLDFGFNREKLIHFPICREIFEPATTYEDRSGILFVGGYKHSPNIDAVVYFLSEIYPHIVSRRPDVEFNIVGSHIDLLLPHISTFLSSFPGINIIGFVDEIGPLMESSRLSVAPLRYGAGTKGKVISSICHGLPCISTSIAVEGITDFPQPAQLIADEPLAMSQLILELYSNSTLWKNVSKSVFDYARDSCSVSNYERILRELLF